jgi:hypothetical protein
LLQLFEVRAGFQDADHPGVWRAELLAAEEEY